MVPSTYTGMVVTHGYVIPYNWFNFINVWTAAAEVTHVGGHTWRTDPREMLAAHHASAERYVGLVYPHRWQAPLRAAVARGLASRLRREVAAATTVP